MDDLSLPLGLEAGAVVDGPALAEPVRLAVVAAVGDRVRVVGEGLRTGRFHQLLLDKNQLSEMRISPAEGAYDGSRRSGHTGSSRRRFRTPEAVIRLLNEGDQGLGPLQESQRAALPAGGYAVARGEQMIATVGRKTFENLVASLSDGALAFQMQRLGEVARAAVVVEGRYSASSLSTFRPRSSPMVSPGYRFVTPRPRWSSQTHGSSPKSGPTGS